MLKERIHVHSVSQVGDIKAVTRVFQSALSRLAPLLTCGLTCGLTLEGAFLRMFRLTPEPLVGVVNVVAVITSFGLCTELFPFRSFPVSFPPTPVSTPPPALW